MNDTIDRKRSVDVDSLTDEQVELLIEQIGNKVRALVDETCDKANKMLNVYNMQVKMQVIIQQKDEPQE